MKYKNEIKNKKRPCSAEHTLIAKPKELKDLKKNEIKLVENKMQEAKKENVP